MILAAFALGVWLAWLLSGSRNFFQASRREKRALIIRAILFVIVAGVFIWSLVDSYLAAWPSLATRIVNFVTAPAEFWFIVALATGWCVYTYRQEAREFVGALLIRPSKDKAPSGGTPGRAHRTGGADEQAATDHGSGEPTAGAPRVAIIAALFLFAFLVYLGPDLRSRLQSFKFGNVEANFSAVTQRSLSSGFALNAPSHDNTGYAPNSMILELGGLKNDLALLFGPGGQQIAEYWGLAGSNLALVADRQDRVRKFYEQIAIPLIDAIGCDRNQLPIRDDGIQQSLILLAIKWRDLSEKVARSAGGSSAAPTVPVDPKALFNEAANETRDLINRIYDKYSRPPSTCTNPNPKVTAAGLDAYVPELFKNGYIIAFVASLVASTHDYLRAVEYLNRMASSLDTNSADPSGKMYFYVKRYEAKYYARWYPHDALSDLKIGRHVLDGMLTAVTDRRSKFADSNKVITYLDNTRAGYLNMEIFSRFQDWLEGRRLSPVEIETLETLSADFQKWAQSQSSTALADNINDWLTGPTIHLLATAYDTLAMNDIAMGQAKSDLGKDRCARIMERLVTSRNIFEFWSRVYVNSGKGPESTFRDVFKTLDAHRDLYDSVCAT